MINRDMYLNKLLAYKDTEFIKVITGIRRCGKSSLLKLFMEKILEDENIANMLLDYSNSINLDLLYYILRKFFKDYPLKEYINVINQLKDWDVVKGFYGGEEELNSFNDKDWDRLMKSIYPFHPLTTFPFDYF